VRPHIRQKPVRRRGLGLTPWVDAAMTGVWPTVQRCAPQGAVPTLARGWIDSGRHRVSVNEYGCGLYGCVMPTETPGVVLKITTDGLEAAFVHFALRHPWPAGIVQYYGAYAMPLEYMGHYMQGESVEGVGVPNDRPAYLLWREEAYPTKYATHKDLGFPKGPKLSSSPLPLQAAAALLRRYRTLAQLVRRAITRARPENVLELLVTIQSQLKHLPARLRRENRKIQNTDQSVYVLSTASDRARGMAEDGAVAAEALAFCRVVATAMQQNEHVALIGYALDFYASEGMLLADVHPQNVGLRSPARAEALGHDPEAMIIIDPGQMVPLRPKLVSAGLPPLACK